MSECGVVSNPYFPIFGVISGPCFPVFVLDAGICGVGRRIRSGCGGCGPVVAPCLGTFDAVSRIC